MVMRLTPKSGDALPVVSAPVEPIRGVAIGIKNRRISAMASFVDVRCGLRRSPTPVWFVKTIDGDSLALGLPLGKKLVEKSVMFLFRDAQATTFLPKEKLFCPSQQSVPEVQLKGPTVCISVRDGVDDCVTWQLI
jgi:hypothetical protein